MEKLKIGDRVIIDLSKKGEAGLGITSEMREYDGEKTRVVDIDINKIFLEIDKRKYTWDINWIKKIPLITGMAVDLEDVKDIQRLIKNNLYQQNEKEEFDGRKYKDKKTIYAQMTKEKDIMNKEKVILKRMLFTEKLEDIDRNKDFFLYAQNKLVLYGKKRLELFHDIPILNMAAPEKRKTDKPTSLYNIKSKELDSDILIAIKKLIEKAKSCDIDADVYFMLDSIKSKGELIEVIQKILGMSHRRYDEKAYHIFEALHSLIESLL